MTTNIYVDGFNLYYGSLRRTNYRWLDLEALCANLLPGDQVKRIRYFTAKVSGSIDPTAPQRQQTYLRALRTLSSVSIHFGHFLSNPVWMPIYPPPAKGSKKAHVLKTEEKGSDVNLASHLLLDSFRQDSDSVVIISNDSDLTEPLRMARFELGRNVGVLNPHPANRRSRVLSADANFFKQIRPSALGASQFTPTLVDSVGTFHKPPSW